MATSRRASPCASTNCWSRCACRATALDGLAGRERRGEIAPPAAGARGVGLVEGWRGPVFVALEAGARRHASGAAIRTIPRGRTGRVLEHADHRQHRSGLPAHQQVLQPVLQRTRPVGRCGRRCARSSRTGLVTEPRAASATTRCACAQRCTASIARRARPRAGIRHVDAGSCNGCELEIHALDNPSTTSKGCGIRFVASPRHADLLLVTGPVSRNMEEALRRTYDATPEPKLVVAVGDCGCAGGIFGESYACAGRVSNVIPVDVAVPGCPPAPARILPAFSRPSLRHGPDRSAAQSGGRGMNSVSPGTCPNLLASQSALACSMRSLLLATKFHQICRGPSAGSPPSSMMRAGVSALMVMAWPARSTSSCGESSRSPAISISPSHT